ncbi:hypothetical protein H2200_003965 [Cladophialophora chaetospira]|uniref:Uncharacterized protein n=1 Tax=Cladophialophora chaetospira TaxID=386627 RepID=A0AA38XF75_9EURO|nr:hypothetical protein H2200_003965 [Cladophialophora chaetospira]
METPRRRVYSFSSNETILEIYSSSPPSSTGMPDREATFACQSPANDLLAPLRPDAQSRKRSYDAFQRTIEFVEERQSSAVVEDDEEEGNDSEESINWDESSEDEEEQERQRYPKEPEGQSTFPRTIGFWFDSWVAQVGANAVNIDLQALCAGMQLWRATNEVPRVPTHLVQTTQSSSSITPYCANALRDEDGSFASQSDWDALLLEMKALAKDRHQGRKRRGERRRNVAAWASWGAKERAKERGEFVEEQEVGYELEREVDGQKWIVKLGYRRKDAVVEDMDLDLDEEFSNSETLKESHGGKR